jgi:hypothetical protein
MANPVLETLTRRHGSLPAGVAWENGSFTVGFPKH